MTRRRKPLYISTVTLAELLSGIQALPQGRRWHLLDDTLSAPLGLSRDRVLSFVTEAVWCYAELAVAARNGGRDLAALEWIHRRHRRIAGLHRGVTRYRALRGGGGGGHQSVELT
ncbi:hypothetical protein [Burkholderia multivorans]|uniref:hypothetical protein n=1 Tax=Burkholderia multivorans TaxID=87883 RepID=UPI003C6C7614